MGNTNSPIVIKKHTVRITIEDPYYQVLLIIAKGRGLDGVGKLAKAVLHDVANRNNRKGIMHKIAYLLHFKTYPKTCPILSDVYIDRIDKKTPN